VNDTDPKPIPIREIATVFTKVGEVEYDCWICGRRQSYTRFNKLPDPTNLRCYDCAKRDGDLTVDEWQEIIRADDKISAYQRALAERKTRKAPAVDDSRLQIPALFRSAKSSHHVLEWIEENPNSRPLVFMGPTGSGKTYQACAALREVMNRTPSGSCRLVNCAGIGRLMAKDIDSILTNAAIVLDDLGAKLTPAAVSTAYEIIDYRTAQLRPLIVTSNLELAQIAAMDERIASRLSRGKIVRMAGKDRRIAEGAAR